MDQLVPIGTSALLQVRWLRELFGGSPDTVGVITFSSENLTDDHFKGVALDVAPPVKGMPVGGAFHNWMTCTTEFDFAACEAEVVQAAKEIQRENPRIRAICFECVRSVLYSLYTYQANYQVYKHGMLGHFDRS